MTREEARKKSEVMMAYAEGKEIESFDEHIGDWVKNDHPMFNWGINVYRIKQEPTYRPFKDKNECWAEMQKHHPFGWVKHKDSGTLSCITGLSNNNHFDYYNENYTFADEIPFGIKEE